MFIIGEIEILDVTRLLTTLLCIRTEAERLLRNIQKIPGIVPVFTSLTCGKD